MNRLNYQSFIIFFIIFFIFAQNSTAEVLLANKKVVEVDTNWIVTAYYKQKIGLKNDADVIKYRVIQRPKTVFFRKVRDARASAVLYSGKKLFAGSSDGRLIFNRLDAPVELTYEVKIISDFREMGGFFADRFKAVRTDGSMENYYKITFPKPLFYRWTVQYDDYNEDIRTAYGKFFKWETPSTANGGFAIVKVSTVKDWAFIKAYYSKIYEKNLGQAALSAILPKIDQWQRVQKDAALRMVFDYIQANIQYHPRLKNGSLFAPARLDEVLQRGRGDCKDMAALTVKVLRMLGFKANVVLCAPKDKIDPGWPDPFVFNHAIVQVVIDQEERYYDLTRSDASVVGSSRESTFMLSLDQLKS